MFGCCDLCACSLCQEIEVTVTTDDHVVRNEVENHDVTAYDRQDVCGTGYDCTCCIDGDGLAEDLRVCGLIHSPELTASGVLALGYGCACQNCLEEGNTCCRRRDCDLLTRCQRCPDTCGHLCTCTEQDSLIERDADCLTDACDELLEQVDVAVLEGSIADCYIAADLVAVNLNLGEAEVELVDVGAHLCPDCLRDNAHDGLSCCSAYSYEADSVDELGILHDVLADQIQNHLRDEIACACHASLVLHHLASSLDEALDVLALAESCALFDCHCLESSYCHDCDLLRVSCVVICCGSGFSLSCRCALLMSLDLFEF